MDAELTKTFAFSASHKRGERSIGANYTLSVTTKALDESAEDELDSTVRSELIMKLHTNDFSAVDFLKGVEPEDSALLRAFWSRLSGPLAKFVPRKLALQRDSRTTTTLYL